MVARRLASSLASTLARQGELWFLIWKSETPPRVRMFMWRLCKGALPILDNLGRRKPGIDTLCPICGDHIETVKHTFLLCPFARQIWALSCIPWRNISCWHHGIEEWILQVMREISSVDIARFFTLCWVIWQKRCQKLMENQLMDPMNT
ncbi:UNVERIFIED_CONTAM: hypothetical protein Sradi_2093400 [Sesamum radiatum]|uniref:Reverse transcriptase zinc-binding domain-containing protein n=1 Tax=Sesamum radiatum TaxID=300843 RepID=A0AAW2TIH7_SESRA